MKKLLFLTIVAFWAVITVSAQSDDKQYLNWSFQQAKQVCESARLKDRLGANVDLRILNTHDAISYEMRATLMTPDVIRATARFHQLQNRLTNEETEKLVAEAEAVKGIVVLVELDPREGSGVIPQDWRAFLQPRGTKIGDAGAVTGVKTPELRDVKAFSGTWKRDYAFDRFWLVFPYKNADGKANFASDLMQLELYVAVKGSDAAVQWILPNR